MRCALAALASLPLACAAPEPEGPLRVGVDTGTPAHILAEAGAVGGLPPGIEATGYSSPGALRTAFASGEIDAAVMSVTAAIQTDTQIVLALSHSDGADRIVARRGISRVEEVEATRVGVDRETLAPLVLHRALEMHGIEFASVEVVALPQSGMAEAFDAGRIDAAVCEMRTAGELLQAVGRRAIFTTEQMPGEAALVLAVRTGQLRARMGQVQDLSGWWDGVAVESPRGVPGHRLLTAEENALLLGRDGPLWQGFRAAAAGLEISAEARLSPALLESLGHAVD